MKTFTGLCLGLLLVVGPARAGQEEPMFEGKPMGYWLELMREIPQDMKNALPDVRKAPWALRKIGEPAVPALVELLQDSNPEIRRRAAGALLGMGPKAKGAVPALVEALENSDSELRQKAALILGQIGPAAKEAVPDLTEALEDPEPRVRVAAATSLGWLGAKEAVPALQTALKDTNKAVQKASREALRKIEKEKTAPKEH